MAKPKEDDSQLLAGAREELAELIDKANVIVSPMTRTDPSELTKEQRDHAAAGRRRVLKNVRELEQIRDRGTLGEIKAAILGMELGLIAPAVAYAVMLRPQTTAGLASRDGASKGGTAKAQKWKDKLPTSDELQALVDHERFPDGDWAKRQKCSHMAACESVGGDLGISGAKVAELVINRRAHKRKK